MVKLILAFFYDSSPLVPILSLSSPIYDAHFFKSSSTEPSQPIAGLTTRRYGVGSRYQATTAKGTAD
jgi:hypothetical protein